MNACEITTTEIKVEVQLETTSIVKVETTRGHNNKVITAIENSQLPALAIGTNYTQFIDMDKEKTRVDQEAKKFAKQTKKLKDGVSAVSDAVANTSNTTPMTTEVKNANISAQTSNLEDDGHKSREQIRADREAKKLAKQAAKTAKTGDAVNAFSAVTDQRSQIKLNEKNAMHSADTNQKKQALSKAERRAIQEAQRAAKAQSQIIAATAKAAASRTTVSTTEIKSSVNNASKSSLKPLPALETKPVKRVSSKSPVKTVRFNDGNVKLFSHLEKPNTNVNLFVNNMHIHPCIARLGEQYSKRTIVGSNARCLAFLNVMKMVIQDFETPPKKEFIRSLEAFIANCVEHLQKCRVLAVSVINANKSLKQVLMQLPKDEADSELKQKLFTFIDTYIENQIGKAAQAINSMMQKKINNGDIILTFGCSSLVNYICEEAQSRKVDFRVIVVDSRPFCEGQELLRRLTAREIKCSYVLINAVSFVMPEVTKVFMGAHALLANGNVMARTGTAQVALVARSFNVPVLVCCETHKFSERFQTDAIVYNELGNPDDIVVDEKCCLSNWQSKHKMSPLNLNYDITPHELVTAVVTEVSVLPCTSVPVILRMKPDWLV